MTDKINDMNLSDDVYEEVEYNEEINDNINNLMMINSVDDESVYGETSTKTVTGYDILPLPEEANGRVSGVELRGQTATNHVKNGDFRNGTDFWDTVGYTAEIVVENGKAINKLENVENKSIMTSNYLSFNNGDKIYIRLRCKLDSLENISRFALINGVLFVQGYTDIAPTTEYTTQSFITTWTDGNRLRLFLGFNTPMSTKLYLDYMMAINLTETFGAGNEPTVEECDAIFTHYFDGTKSTVGAIRIRSTSEDETQGSIQYITAKDQETNKVVNLRSLPNGVSDRIYRGTEGKWYLEKNIEDSSQLPSPIIKEIDVQGDLTVYPSGTIYIEPVIKNIEIYNNQVKTPIPVDYFESLVKIDSITGAKIELDPSQAIITDNGFTHPLLSNGDIVEYVYYYNKSNTVTPKVTLTYDTEKILDKMNFNIKDYHDIIAPPISIVNLLRDWFDYIQTSSDDYKKSNNTNYIVLTDENLIWRFLPDFITSDRRYINMDSWLTYNFGDTIPFYKAVFFINGENIQPEDIDFSYDAIVSDSNRDTSLKYFQQFVHVDKTAINDTWLRINVILNDKIEIDRLNEIKENLNPNQGFYYRIAFRNTSPTMRVTEIIGMVY